MGISDDAHEPSALVRRGHLPCAASAQGRSQRSTSAQIAAWSEAASATLVISG
jgi:hypothetical protein